MADIGFNPPGLRHDRVVAGLATEAGIIFGDLLIQDTATVNDHRAAKRTAIAGGGPVKGVCVSQMGPSGGSLGDSLEVCDEGIVEINLVPLQAVVKGDILIASTTAGAVKVLAAEALAWQVGIADMDMAAQAGVVRISCRLQINKRAA